MKISPKRYIQGFCVVVLALGWARALHPSLAYNADEKAKTDSLSLINDSLAYEKAYADSVRMADSLASIKQQEEEKLAHEKAAEEAKQPEKPLKNDAAIDEGPFVPHRIYSVSDFKTCFPDQNDIQLIAAQRYGVKPVASRADAEKRQDELVYVGSNPYYYVDRLKSSIPYLVPKASVLVQDIGKTFFDSLQVKGIPLHKIIVTSALRSKEDVAKLQQRNQNATTNSCHQYGTTVDICYNRYKTVEDPNGPARRAVTNDTLKWVLSEVLNDFRKQGRCYVKYEVKQSCFHLTVR